MDEKELAKQVSTYADSITAFAFVQGIAFLFLAGQNVTFACIVGREWQIASTAIFVASCGYFLMVFLCHHAENRLIGVPQTRGIEIGAIVRRVRLVRQILIIAIAIGEIGLAVSAGVNQAFDCCHILKH